MEPQGASQKGRNLFHQGNRQAAKECFIEGLAQAETYHYNKQIVKNLIGLSNCSMDQNVAEARTFLSRAAAIAEEVGMYHEKKTLQAAFERLQKYIDSVRGADYVVARLICELGHSDLIPRTVRQ